jgi:acetate---CoA ligase (ADP-forming)
VAVAVMGDEVALPDKFIPSIRHNGIPFFRSPERAIRAMAHATAYGRRLARSSSSESAGWVERSETHHAGSSDAMGLALLDPSYKRTGVIPEYEGKRIISALGIAVPRGALATSLDEARRIATEIGYPVVLKAQGAALAHKSEAGGVIVGIADHDALAAAWDRLHANVAAAKPDLGLDGVLVEAMAPAGIEMAVGGRRDPDWGPVVMAGLGGIWIEALADVRLMPADLGRAEVLDELSRLKGAALLRGLRGRPPADTEALAAAILTIGALMRQHPEITEIDVNPLLVLPRHDGVLALDVLLVTSMK